MKMNYIWQDPQWPHLRWDSEALSQLSSRVNNLRGVLSGKLSMVGLLQQSFSMLDAITQEIVDSSQIEGQNLNRDSVRSSVARQLGLEHDGLVTPDHFVEGVVEVMLDATRNHDQPLSPDRLFGWHAALFPTGYSGPYKIVVGSYRQGEDPMQVVSGPLGRQQVHFQAPPSSLVPQMMQQFLSWIDLDQPPIDPLVKAAVAHLWFVTIHPFDDGNGRLTRTITELMLSRADHTDKRFYSLSSTILEHRKDYYQQLEAAQKGNLDITPWVEWFLLTIEDSINHSLQKLHNVMRKTSFWDQHADTPVNERQRKVLNMLFDGFEGKLNTSKWYKINHCSQDTALRDIKDLVAKGILRVTSEGGRSTNYELIP